MEHDRDSDIPSWLKWSLTVFNRAGFPALAFMLICYLLFVTVGGQTKAIEDFKSVITQMTIAIDHNTASVERMTQALYRTRP